MKKIRKPLELDRETLQRLGDEPVREWMGGNMAYDPVYASKIGGCLVPTGASVGC